MKKTTFAEARPADSNCVVASHTAKTSPSTETDNTITEEYRFITSDDPSIEQKRCTAFHLRRESISGGSPTSFPGDTSMPYSRFEPEPTQLQAECHNYHPG
ncbi:hypothetical protein TNCV_4735371 [Trichonephila clavipes]|nr:hypothetical protein TNCV_4735371 [Trichonephila clavipes]